MCVKTKNAHKEVKMKKANHYVILISGIILLITGFCLVKLSTEPQWFMQTLPYVCIGIGCGMFGHGISNIINKKALERDPILAKQKDIEANDERNIQHANISKAKGFTMMTYVFSALLLVYAFMGVSPKILLPFVISYLFVQFYAFYHRLKIDKEQ